MKQFRRLVMAITFMGILVLCASQAIATDNDLVSYKNHEYGYEIKYPKEWSLMPDYVKQNLNIGLRDFFYVTQDRYGMGGSLSVQVWDTSLYSYEELSEINTGGVDPDSVKENTIIIDGHPAKEVSFYAVGDAGSGGKDGKQISVKNNKLIYRIQCFEECARIMPSFIFLNEKTSP